MNNQDKIFLKNKIECLQHLSKAIQNSLFTDLSIKSLNTRNEEKLLTESMYNWLNNFIEDIKQKCK